MGAAYIAVSALLARRGRDRPSSTSGRKVDLATEAVRSIRERDLAKRRRSVGGVMLMTTAKYDVLGIGNAIFDILVRTDEDFLARTA